VPYVVDGNNLLGSWGGPRGEDGRAEVVRRVAVFCRAKGARATVVFDGRPLRPDMAEQSLGPVTIRVPPEGQDADSVIRRIVEESSAPGDLIVVTSDKALYSYAKTFGAAVLRAHEWNALERRSAARAPPGAAKPDPQSDVEGWLRRFGGGD
jgi:predicted RNA-binding protein with PIN domain